MNTTSSRLAALGLALSVGAWVGCDRNGNNGPNGTGAGNDTAGQVVHKDSAGNPVNQPHTGAKTTPGTSGGIAGSTGTEAGQENSTGAPGGGVGAGAVNPSGNNVTGHPTTQNSRQ